MSCRYSKRKLVALTLITIGIALFVIGFFPVFYWQHRLEQGFHTVKAGASFERSWYLEKGDRTEGFFNISGGNGQANLIVKNPSGAVIVNWTVTGLGEGPFGAEETGTYTMILRNLDNVHDQIIYVGFLSPYDYFHSSYPARLLMIGGSIIILLLGIGVILKRN